MKMVSQAAALKTWAREWPECRNHEGRSMPVPRLRTAIEALRNVEGLIPFLAGQGYKLERMQ